MLTQSRSDHGFTLIELMVAISIGMLVLFAGFTIIDRSFANNQRIVKRQDSLQRGRTTLELITRALRSQVCLQTNPAATVPIVSGTGNSVSFYAYLGDPTATGIGRDATSNQPYPQQHTIAYNTTTNVITDTVANLTSFSPLTTGAATTRTLVSNVRVISSLGTIFQYYGPGTAGTSAASSTPMMLSGSPTPTLTAAQRASVVQIGVGYRVLPTGSTNVNDPQATTFQNQVLWRAVDPENPTDQPCDNG